MPTIFISYSHDNDAHAARVLALADRLIADGLECVLDQYIGDPPEGWPRWMDRQIKAADLVLMICTETYYKRVMGEEKQSIGLGVKWEGNLIYQHLYQGETVNEKFIPVLFENGQVEHIPTLVQGNTFYKLTSEEDYDELYWRLTNQHQVPKPKKGQMKTRPPQKRAPLFPDAPPAPPEVSLGSLPVTGSELFGREEELAQLDAAWADPQTRIFVLVAWGGVGKTSLVNTWLFKNMAQDDYRGARRVFGWSFYSQGAAEGKQVSADRFVADALRWFGDPNPDEGDPIDKGRRLATLIKQQKTLLVLDGLEPLQYPPGSEEGRLKDRGLCLLLRELAAHNPGLCVITTRLALNDLQNFFSSSVHNVMLTHLSPQAGVQVLHNAGVQGTEQELRQAVTEFDGHALTLNLLGTYLYAVYDGDIRQRDKIPQLVYTEERQGRHVRRVMESYECWFAETDKGRRELQILRLMGLFDRPATLDALESLLAEPVIPGLTDSIQFGGGGRLSTSPAWKFAIKDLQDLRLLAEPHCLNRDASDFFDDHDSPSSSSQHQNIKDITPITRITVLDTHPLLREHFGAKLQQEQPAAWQEAHSRLYEYYKNLPDKELPDTLEEMEPLFAAVSHGCLAGRHQDALMEVYFKRIRRKNEDYTIKKLGAFGANLAAVANFFEELWTRPAAGLNEALKAFILNQAGFGLRGVGRLREAAQPMQTGIELRVQQENWKGAAINAGNLSELWLTLGEVAQAVAAARQSVKFADRSGDRFTRMIYRNGLANMLHQAGEFKEAKKLFRESEAMQQEQQPEYPYLYSLQGFQFCDLLLSLGQAQEVQQRTAQTLERAKQFGFLLDIALNKLSLGWAWLLQTCPGINVPAQSASRLKPAMPEQQGVLTSLGSEAGDLSLAMPEAIAYAADYLHQAVAGLREAGDMDELPRGLLARVALFRVQHEFDKAWIDLHEAHEIADRGEMRLWLTDYHLEAARLIREQLSVNSEQLSVGGEQLSVSSEQLSVSGEEVSWEKAREHLETAARLVEETGYHRRDREVEELRLMLDVEC